VSLAWLVFQSLGPVTPRVTSFRAIAQRAHDFRGLATDGTNVYFAEKRFPVDALLVVPLSGGDAREMPLPWESRVDLHLFDVLDGPPSLLVGRRTSLNEGFDLWRLPLVGGAATRLGGLPRVASARASRAGDRVAYIPSPGEPGAGGVFLTERGGPPRLVVPPEDGTHREVVGWHPGDARVRYVRYPTGPEPELCFDVATGSGATAPTGVPDGTPGWFHDWSPDGRFTAWGAQDGVFAFAVRRPLGLRATAPVRLAAPSHVANLRFTPDGRRIVTQVERPGTEIVVLGGGSEDLAPLLGGARAGSAEYSPDGSWVAWVTNDGRPGRVWRSRPDGSQAAAVTDPDRLTVGPLASLRWSPDGRFLAFAARGAAKDPGPPTMHLADVGRGTVELLSGEDGHVAHIDPCWAADGRSLVYSTFFPPYASEADTYLRRVDLATRRIEKLPGSDGLWAPKCAPDGRILAADSTAQRTQPGEGRTWFKLWDPWKSRWEALPVAAATVDHPSWSRDGRALYATASRLDAPGLQIARVDVRTRRVETVGRIEGLRPDGWLGLTPDGALMVHRDASVREIVVMEWEAR